MGGLLDIYRKIIPEKQRKALNEFLAEYNTNRENKCLMERKSFGELNKDKTFYVVRTDSTQEWGIARAACMVLNNIKYAQERGWIPVVDYKNYYLCNSQDEEDRGKKNAWEEYFEQPDTAYSLEEVYHSRNVVLGPLRGQPVGSVSWNNIENLYSEQYNYYFDLTHKYIRLKPEILKEAEAMRGRFLEKAAGRKILGMGMRMGLYWAELTNCKNYSRHPKGVGIDDYIEAAYKYMEEYGCDYLFISCEDRYGLERMKQEFGDKCFYVEGRSLLRYFDEEGRVITNSEERRFEVEQEKIIKRSVDYMIEVYILSKCDSLYMAQGGGAILACLMNNKEFENYCCIRKGFME